MKQVKYLPVGRSGLKVSNLGLGTQTWGRGTSQDDATAMLQQYHLQGGNFVELAPDAFPMFATAAAATGINKDRDELVLSVASGVDERATYGHRVDTSRRNLLAELDHALRSLQVDHIDLWTVGHWDPQVPCEEVAHTLSTAINQGKVRYAGVRGYEGWQLALLHSQIPHLLVAAQSEYHLLARGAETQLIPAASYLGVGVIAGAPIAHGVLSGQYQHGIPQDSRAARGQHTDVHALLAATTGGENGENGERANRVLRALAALATAAEGLGISMAVAASAWVRQQPGVSAIVSTPRTPQQLQEYLESAQVHIPRSILAALDDVTL
ncbi:aldo/keto reductase [Corynebacterium sp. 70RC1]|uniref:aldo/keto reductase n=1 Tax=Corynebacterium sp. 70RC1 TaxID=2968461 RepID=UPI00211C0D1C